MMQTMTLWDEAEPVLREKAYRRMESDPESLLMHDTALGVQAEMYLARLVGLDDEHVQDVWITSALPVYRVPIVRSRFTLEEDLPFAPEPIRAADYYCQNYVCVTTLAAEYAPKGVTLRPDFTFRVAYLLYKRRLT